MHHSQMSSILAIHDPEDDPQYTHNFIQHLSISPLQIYIP